MNKKSLKSLRVITSIAAICLWLISSMFLVATVRESSLTFLMCSIYAWLTALTFFMCSMFMPIIDYVEDKLEEERNKKE